MKKILSLLTVLAMLLTAAAVPATAASPELTSIYGNKGLILAELSESVTPESVKITDTDGNEIKNTYEVKSGSIEIKPEKELKLDKRYVLSIATAEGELEKYITLKTLYKDDFSSDEYTKSNLYSCKWSDTDTWSVKNGRLVRATVLNTYDTQIKKTAENSEWKDYTVEFDYIGSEKTGSYSMDLALNVHFYINGNNATLNNGDGKNYYTTAVNLDTKNKNPIDMGFRASIFGNKTYTKLTNLSTNAVLKENSHTEATGNAKKTSGPFGFSGYHGWSDKGTNVIDNLVCYKLIYSDVEYKADIANNAKDLRNVSEINFDWKIALDSMPKKENIEIADKDGNPYTDFEVSEEGGKTKITFNEELKPENTYTITFSSLTSGGEPVDSITHKFSMGGIYTGVSIEGESVIEAGKETSFKAYAVAESGALCEVPLSSLAFSSSDESVISIDESGDAKANSKGMATVSVVFTDSNTQNPYGTTFEKAINVYSYVDKEDKLKITETSKKIADFKYDNAAVIAEFDDDLSKEFAIILGDLTIKTDGLNYKIGNSEIAREAGKHTFEIVKKDGKFSVYLDGIEALSGFSADNCKAISAGGNLTSVKIYDLQGFPKVESIVGSRGNIIVKFNEEVNVGSVSVFDMNQNEITASFSLNKDKTEVTVTPENPLEFKKYVLTVNTDKKSYSSYISFDVLYENDFNNASSLSEYNTWGSGEVKDSGIRGGHPVYGPVLKNTDANKKWQDYTVEWVINGTDNVGVSTFRTVLYSNNASHTNYGESYGGFGLCVELGASSGVTVTSASNEKITQDITDSYPQSENGSKNFDYNYFAGTDKKWTTSVSILGDKVFGAVYDKDGNAVHKLTSTLKTTPKNTAGAFGFNANSKPESTDGVNNFHYTDYVVAYKLVASDLEYSSSIANGAKNLYDVNELELKWNYDIASVDNSNIEITEVSKNGESTYTDFSVSHEDNKTVITFNTALNGESKYNIAFKNIDGLNPMPISFTMGGVFERINASGNNVLKVKESGQISVNGTTDTGTVFDIDLENVELASSDESVISVNSSGKIEALDRGYATIDIRYTDTNTTNPNLDSNGQLGTQINVYSYMSSSEAKADSDFDFRDGLLRGEFKESISVKFDNGFVYEKASDGDAHTLEILKDSDGFRVFLDGSEVKTGSADGCKKITEITGFEKAEAYNLIGNVCYAEYLNVRGTKTLTAEYSYKDSDGDKESGSAIEWYYSGSSDGAYTKIANADGKTLNASGYNGKYVKFAVTPSNKYEKGERVESAPVKVNISGGSSNGSSSSSSAKKNNTSVSITATGGVTEPTVETTGIFKDVAGTHWAYASIKAMKEKGVVNGFSDGTFKPDSPVTRAEFVCALSKLLGLGEASYSGTFSDVSESDWFAGYVQAAYNSGYVKGEGELFRPNDTITRQEMAVIIARVINSSERAELNFTDSSDISDWAIDSVKSVLAKGIMTGNADGSFSPHASTTRAQMAAIMERISK